MTLLNICVNLLYKDNLEYLKSTYAHHYQIIHIIKNNQQMDEKLQMFAVNYNMLRICHGLGGLAYST